MFNDLEKDKNNIYQIGDVLGFEKPKENVLKSININITNIDLEWNKTLGNQKEISNQFIIYYKNINWNYSTLLKCIKKI